MERLIVTRTGGPLYCGALKIHGRDLSSKAPPRSELDTEPMLRRLCQEFGSDKFVVFGRATEPHLLPCEYLEPDIRGLDRFCSLARFKRRMEPSIARLRELEVVGAIDMLASRNTWSTPGNPAFAFPRDSDIRYSGPQLYAYQELEIPRFGVVTDPKCYKRDGEFVHWPWTVPQAILSQETRQWDQRVQGKLFRVYAVSSGAEYWHTWEMVFPEGSNSQWDIGIVANTHLKQKGQLPRGRDAVWQDILNHCSGRTAVCGTHWDMLELGSATDLGTLPTSWDVLTFLSDTKAGPCIPQISGFNTTKPRLYAMSGAVPNLYVGEPRFTYDPHEKILPLNHPSRWPAREYDREETLELVLEKTEPDFSLLFDLVEAALSGKVTYPEDAWLEKFGGVV